MLKPSDLHDYQKECVLHMMYNPDAMLWLQVGLGKTIITLTAITDLINSGKMTKVLIFGPVKVINSVWHTEIKKWEHTKHLRCSLMTGTPVQRKRALFRDADIYLCSYENINWLTSVLNHYFVKENEPLPFNAVVYDEVTKMKNSTSMRVKGGKSDVIDENGEYHVKTKIGWRKFIDLFQYRYGLTGTPAPNGYMDLHGQYLAVDGGKRLGTHKTHYQQAYFTKSYDGFSHEVKDLGKQWIERKISDITKKMDAADYLDMPKVTEVNVYVDLPDKVKEQYKELERNLFVELDGMKEVEVFHAASLSNKCHQFCNGTPYVDTETKESYKLHDRKLKALAEILDNANGQPVLCSYAFKSDAKRIMEHFKKYKPVNLTEEKGKHTQRVLNQFKQGKIKLLIGHPMSMGHGIDGLQSVCSIVVWFGLTWNLEHYEQMNGRINRQGQPKPVTVIRIMARNTVEDGVMAPRLQMKDDSQTGLKRAMQAYKNNTVSFI